MAHDLVSLQEHDAGFQYDGAHVFGAEGSLEDLLKFGDDPGSVLYEALRIAHELPASGAEGIQGQIVGPLLGKAVLVDADDAHSREDVQNVPGAVGTLAVQEMEKPVFGFVADVALLHEALLQRGVHFLEKLYFFLKGHVEGVDEAGGFEVHVLQNVPACQFHRPFAALGGFLGGAEGFLKDGVQIVKVGGRGEAPGAVNQNSHAQAVFRRLFAVAQFSLQEKEGFAVVVFVKAYVGVFGAGSFQAG